MKNQSDKSPSLIQSKNFLTQTCSQCNEEMHIGEGDIIFGGKWFHNSCWQKAEISIVDNSG